MPRFEPILESHQLPPVGDGYERAVLDLKGRGGVAHSFHMAKDVAAFANHLGGTLLIGAKEEAGRVGEYDPLNEETTNGVQKKFSEAVRDRCSPRPLVDFARLARDGGFVLAVNVWPYVGQVVGVRVKADKAADAFGDQAYVFPVRVGVDATYLYPEQLPMFMTPEVRRAAILLNSVPKDYAVTVRIGRRVAGEAYEEFSLVVDEVDELANVVSFLPANGSRGAGQRSYPLDKVSTVFKDPIRGWRIYIQKFD
jgi:hypothetical protein